jgi:RNA polymerase sigma factor (TIGR02999 family)
MSRLRRGTRECAFKKRCEPRGSCPANGTICGMSESGLDGDQLGRSRAIADLLPQVYDELRRLAAAKLAHEPPGHTLDATALVHEAYLKLGGEPSFPTQSCFMRAAAQAMRRVLVDHARAKRAEKRGGKWKRIDRAEAAAPADDPDLIALDSALADFASVDPEAAELVQLRYFTGLTIPQAAEALGISARTADRVWAYGRAWLFRRLGETWRD